MWLNFFKKIVSLVYYLFKLGIIVALAMAIWRGQWLNMAAIIGILILVSLPAILKKNYQIFIPFEFEMISLIFIYLAIFLGDWQEYYHKFWWWDVYLHLASGFLLGILGFMLVYLLNNSPRFKMNMKAGFVALFALTFAVTMGVVWEFFEYAVDTLFQTNMQKTGLPDTIWDLIMDFIGGFLISSLGYLWMKERIYFYFFDLTLMKFIRYNQRLADNKNQINKNF